MSKVYLVGAGSGDPALLTIKGRRALAQADIVFYDRLLNPLLLYLAPKTAELVFVGKAPDQHAMKQEAIEAAMIAAAQAGQTVVRLKGGDPGFFGRVGEEMVALAEANIPYEVYPGVTSASGASLYAGFAVTHRHLAEKCLIVTPTAKLQAFASEPIAQIAAGGTVVIYMGMERLADLTQIILEQGAKADLPVAVIRWGTWGRQEKVVGNLSDIADKVADHGLTNPALIILGPTAQYAAATSWFEELPNFGQRQVYVTETALSFDEMLDFTDGGADFYPVLVGAAQDERFTLLHQRLLPEYLADPQTQISYHGPAAEVLFQQLQASVMEANHEN